MEIYDFTTERTQSEGTQRHTDSSVCLCVPLVKRTKSLHLQGLACGIAAILGSVCRLHRSTSCLIRSGTVDINGVLQLVSTFPHPVDKERGRSITTYQVITDTSAPMITGKLLFGFHTGGTLVFHLHEVHIAVCRNSQTHRYLIAYVQLGIA